MKDRTNRMSGLFRDSNSPESPEEALTTIGFAPPVDIYEDEHTISIDAKCLAGIRARHSGRSKLHFCEGEIAKIAPRVTANTLFRRAESRNRCGNVSNESADFEFAGEF